MAKVRGYFEVVSFVGQPLKHPIKIIDNNTLIKTLTEMINLN